MAKRSAAEGFWARACSARATKTKTGSKKRFIGLPNEIVSDFMLFAVGRQMNHELLAPLFRFESRAATRRWTGSRCSIHDLQPQNDDRLSAVMAVLSAIKTHMLRSRAYR